MPQLYNVLIAALAFLIITFIVMPAKIGGSGNWSIPIQTHEKPATLP